MRRAPSIGTKSFVAADTWTGRGQASSSSPGWSTPSETRPGGSCSGSLSGSSKMRLAIRIGSELTKHEGATTPIRASSAPIQADWVPPPLVPVIDSRFGSTSGRVSR